VSDLPHSLRLYRQESLAPGPRLLVLGAVHGNETCGTRAIERAIRSFERGERDLLRGSVTFVPVTNPLAYRRGTRIGDRNLNRNLRPKEITADFEDRVGNVLCRLLGEHDVLLDLHSFTAPAVPFVMVGGTDPQSIEWRFARTLGPQRFVTGWMEVYEAGVARRRREGKQLDDPGLLDAGYGVGTTEYMRSRGGYGVTLECGQHDDPEAIEVATRAIDNALDFLGLSDRRERAKVEAAEAETVVATAPAAEVLRLTEVVDREHAADSFVGEWSSFSPVTAGRVVARRHDGREIRAASAGCILFPSRLAMPGHEWFYFARRES
jgi:predicted deacylase